MAQEDVLPVAFGGMDPWTMRRLKTTAIEMYWRVWWWFRDKREDAFVKEVLGRMDNGGHPLGALYVHPHGEAPATYVITKTDNLASC